MYVQIPDEEIKLDLNGHVYDRNNSLIENLTEINLMLGNDQYLFDTEWLALALHFGFNPFKFRDSVIFVDLPKFVKGSLSGKIPVYTPTFYLRNRGVSELPIPIAPNYSIDRFGVVRNAKGEVISNYLRDDYYYCSIVSNDYPNPNTSFRTHRLVAFTYLPNINHDEKPIVNHLDGNKLNINVSNLEWCCFTDNNEHAFETGLRTDNIACMVRDIHDGSVTEFVSIAKASEFLGVNHIRENQLSFLEGHLFKKRYEFKLKKDSTPWFYQDRNEPVRKSRYIVRISSNGAVINEFRGISEIWEAYPNTRSIKSIPKAFEYLLNNLSECSVELIDQSPVKSVDCLNVETGEVKTYNTIRDMSNELELNFSIVRLRVRSNNHLMYGPYVFKYSDSPDWDRSIIKKDLQPAKVEIIDSKTNNVVRTDTLTNVAKYLGVDRSVIKLRLSNGKNFGEFKFRYEVT